MLLLLGIGAASAAEKKKSVLHTRQDDMVRKIWNDHAGISPEPEKYYFRLRLDPPVFCLRKL